MMQNSLLFYARSPSTHQKQGVQSSHHLFLSTRATLNSWPSSERNSVNLVTERFLRLVLTLVAQYQMLHTLKMCWLLDLGTKPRIWQYRESAKQRYTDLTISPICVWCSLRRQKVTIVLNDQSRWREFCPDCKVVKWLNNIWLNWKRSKQGIGLSRLRDHVDSLPRDR